VSIAIYNRDERRDRTPKNGNSQQTKKEINPDVSQREIKVPHRSELIHQHCRLLCKLTK
jgi:hypothetical protein